VKTKKKDFETQTDPRTHKIPYMQNVKCQKESIKESFCEMSKVFGNNHDTLLRRKRRRRRTGR